MRRLRTAIAGAWRELGGYLGNYQSRLLLTACYFTVLAPFGAIARLRDPLRLRASQNASGWIARRSEPAALDPLDRARQMF
jgi:hypothetical protein